MKYEVRKSEQGFYYALEIDNSGNETFLAQADSLEELKTKHNKLKSFSADPINEEDTRGKLKLVVDKDK